MVNVLPALSSYSIPTRDRWVPKVRAGWFFIGDRPYYLYANKKTVRLEQCRHMRIPLVGQPHGTVQVFLEGAPYTNFEIEGTDLVLDLEDLESYISYWAHSVWDAAQWGYYEAGFILTDDTQVTANYHVLQWDAANDQFNDVVVNQNTRFRDAEEEYWLPDEPVPNTPIVITDDSKLPTDQRAYAIEFDVDWEGRITFNAPRNYVQNPNFTASPTGHPEIANDWWVTDPTGIIRYLGTGYVGLWTLRFSETTGKARALIPMLLDEPIALSAYARMSGTGHLGTGYLEVAFKDVDGNIMDTTGGHIGVDPDPGPFTYQVDEALRGREWKRLTLVVGPNDDLEPTIGELPPGVEEIEVRLWGVGSGPVEFDAVQFEKNKRVTQYGYIGPDSTVEYETDPTGIYVTDPTGKSWPFPELNHLDINGASEESHVGFVILEEFSDYHDPDLGIGGIDETDPTGVPRGIVPRTGVFWEFGRRNLPYAEVDGRRKLVNRYPLRLENQAYNEPVNPYQDPREPARAYVVPPENSRRDVDRDLHTTVRPSGSLQISCVFRDPDGNAIIHEPIDMWVVPSGVAPTGVLSTGRLYTNDAGRVMVMYTAPSGWYGESVNGIVFQHFFSGLTRTIDIDIATF